jgi:hypothetical protein
MPLYPDAEKAIKDNLKKIRAGIKAPVVAIGRLTEDQHTAINDARAKIGLPLLVDSEVVYMGRHNYESRSKDGYSIDDVYLQIESAMSADSIVSAHVKMTSMQNPNPREDGYGNQVNDMAVFELTQRKPRAELYSAIPKGDAVKPKDTKAKRPAMLDEPF